MYLIHIWLFFYYVYFIKGDDNIANSVYDVSVNDVADTFLEFIANVGKTDSKRIKELRRKLQRIDSYVIDKDKYAELLRNVTNRTSLNETNFYEAINGQDSFNFQNESKSIYLKLKEKVNREDIIKMLLRRGGPKMMKIVLQMMKNKYKAKGQQEKGLVGVIDKYLGETANDTHKYGKSDEYSRYWDPKVELEERQSYRQLNARRLFRGERTSVRNYPFMASVHVMGRFWCGGAICSHDLVVTSAACLQLLHNNRYYRENPNVVMVRVGSNHSKIGGELLKAMEVYFHPSYNPKTLENNIALIRVIRSIRFNYHRVPKQIEITPEGSGMPFTAEVLVLGWGVVKMGHKMGYEPIFLHRKILPVYPKKFCQDIYGEKFITSTMFCAGTVSTGEGACNHDAGGPAVMNGRLVGVISFGPAVCGMPDAPTVFTLVGAYLDWIETINETMPSYYRANKRTTTPTTDIEWDLFTTHPMNRASMANPYAYLFDNNKKKRKKPNLRAQSDFLLELADAYEATSDNSSDTSDGESINLNIPATTIDMEPIFSTTPGEIISSRIWQERANTVKVHDKTTPIPDIMEVPSDEVLEKKPVNLKALRRQRLTASEELFNAYFT